MRSHGSPADPRPARGAGRDKSELCLRLIEETRKCLENNDKECAMKLIEELVRNRCHNGHVVGKEVADKTRELVHRLWLILNYAEEYELLKSLRKLVSKTFLAKALHRNVKYVNYLLKRYGLEQDVEQANT